MLAKKSVSFQSLVQIICLDYSYDIKMDGDVLKLDALIW